MDKMTMATGLEIEWTRDGEEAFLGELFYFN